jgi:hypothetical protein
MLKQVRRVSHGGGDLRAPGMFGAFPLSLRGELAFLLGALLFEFCGVLSLALCGALSLEPGTLSFELCRAFAFELFSAFPLALCGALAFLLGGALAFLLGGAFAFLPRAFLPLGAFLVPSGDALSLRGVPIPFRAAVATQAMIRPRNAVRRYSFRRRVAVGLHAEAAGIGDRDRPGRGQACERRRVVIRVRPARGR